MGAVIAFWLAGWGGPPAPVPFRIFVAGKLTRVFVARPPQ